MLFFPHFIFHLLLLQSSRLVLRFLLLLLLSAVSCFAFYPVKSVCVSICVWCVCVCCYCCCHCLLHWNENNSVEEHNQSHWRHYNVILGDQLLVFVVVYTRERNREEVEEKRKRERSKKQNYNKPFLYGWHYTTSYKMEQTERIHHK